MGASVSGTAVESLGFAGQRPLPIGCAIGYEIHEFLAWEAFLLDHGRYRDWTGLLAKTILYRCPNQLLADFSQSPLTSALSDYREWGYEFLVAHACGTDPVADSNAECILTRRLVTNVIITPAHCSHEFSVISYVLVTGIQADGPESRMLTAERRDCLRRTSNSFQISRRQVRIHQMAAPMAHFARIL
jgi:3-phenylpropionate/cinnamic acid dioxygenase small subunit